MDSDNVTMLHAEVMPDNPVDAGTSIIKLVVSQHNQNRLLALLASDKNCVASEESEDVHSVVGERDRGVIIVNGISNTKHRAISNAQITPYGRISGSRAHIKLLGFFFFFRIAVDVSSSCEESVI